MKWEDMTMEHAPKDPTPLVERAERVYAEKFKARCEQNAMGQFAAVDAENERVYTGEDVDELLDRASKGSPHVMLHLMRIGSPTAFRTGYAVSADASRPL